MASVADTLSAALGACVEWLSSPLGGPTAAVSIVVSALVVFVLRFVVYRRRVEQRVSGAPTLAARPAAAVAATTRASSLTLTRAYAVVCVAVLGYFKFYKSSVPSAATIAHYNAAGNPRLTAILAEASEAEHLASLKYAATMLVSGFVAIQVLEVSKLTPSPSEYFDASVNEVVHAFRTVWFKRKTILIQGLTLALSLLGAVASWKLLMLITNSPSPVVVVLSGSMEPTFQRGDILFLTNSYDEPIQTGEIVVFNVQGEGVPIVHRVLNVHDDLYLTKGDNNNVHDRGLYLPSQLYLERRHILGRAKGYLPYAGIATILLNDYPPLKFMLIGSMILAVFLNKES